MIFGASFASGLPPAPLWARNADPNSLAAALTLRIAKFITWPERPTIPADRPYFMVGVMGNASSQNAFRKYERRPLKGRSLHITRIKPSASPHSLRRFHIVFVDSTVPPSVIEGMIGKSKGILTVSSPGASPNLATCLNLSEQAGKMVFDINLIRTRKAELRIDAGIIKLARRVVR